MADRRGALVPLLILAFLFFTPGPPQQPGRLERLRIEDVIAEERRALAVVQNSTYGIFDGPGKHALNVTGLEADRGYAWDSLSKIKARAREHLDYALEDWGGQALEGNIRQESPTPLYRNATGIVYGKWLRSKLQGDVAVPQLNLSQYAPEGPFGPMAPRDFRRNITGAGGDIKIRFSERDLWGGDFVNAGPINVTKMMVEMTIEEDESSKKWDLEAHGVYFVELGQALLTTTSSKLAGIFMLPHMALSQHTFNASRAFLNASISRTIERQFNLGFQATLNPWSSSTDRVEETPFSTPECELVIYLQQLEPLAASKAYSSAALSFMENELRFPTGAFLPQEPDLRFSMLAFSPDCGFVMESKGPPDHIAQQGNHLTGAKIEVLQGGARHHLLIFTLVIALQLALLMRQMREASTPSTRSRISFYTIAMLAFGDGFTTISFVIMGISLGGLAMNLLGTAFLAFVSGCFFGMRFLLDVWLVQAPERQAREREEMELERQRRERLTSALQRIREERRLALISSMTAESRVGTELAAIEQPSEAEEPTAPLLSQEPPAGSLPLPVTAQRPNDTGAAAVFMPSDQEGLEDIDIPGTTAPLPTQTPSSAISGFSTVYTRFYLFLLFTLFLSLNAATWPAPARRIYFALAALIYLSFWMPQINRNVKRNCRRALDREFVLGQSALRLTPFAYFYAYKHNVLFADRDYATLALLATWLWIQILVLASQDLLGPRWFVPHDWAPPAYDYHPVLRADEDEEGGDSLPLGLSDSTALTTAQSAPSSPRLRRASSSASSAKDRDPGKRKDARGAKGSGARVFDCAICMQELEAPVVEAASSAASAELPASTANNSSSLAGGLLARRAYMVTPCRHIFHSACLEGWMKYRLQCPICREALPGL